VIAVYVVYENSDGCRVEGLADAAIESCQSLLVTLVNQGRDAIPRASKALITERAVNVVHARTTQSQICALGIPDRVVVQADDSCLAHRWSSGTGDDADGTGALGFHGTAEGIRRGNTAGGGSAR
jgi:hypothetical protein